MIPARGNTSSPQSPQSISPTASLGRNAGSQVAGVPPVARRASVNAITSSKSDSRNPSVSIFQSRNSPPQTSSPLTRNSRTSLERNSPVDREKRGDSPGRRQLDSERSTGRRPSVSSVLSSGKVNPDYQGDRDRRRTLNAINTNTSPSSQRPSPGRSQGKVSGLEGPMAGLTIPSSPSSASSSSGGSSASSDHTVDGGFTDYLSDESEAELQRQAEIKAALVAQNRMEEQEFRAARQQLVTVDLRPPKSWNPDTNGPSRSSAQPAYTTAPFANASYARV